MIYRLIVGVESSDKLSTIVKQYVDSFTILHGEGFWRGSSEPCTIIEIDTLGTEYNPPARVKSIVDDLKLEYNQECVLVQILQCHSKLL